jgi:hypothetical protein
MVPAPKSRVTGPTAVGRSAVPAVVAGPVLVGADRAGPDLSGTTIPDPEWVRRRRRRLLTALLLAAVLAGGAYLAWRQAWLPAWLPGAFTTWPPHW